TKPTAHRPDLPQGIDDWLQKLCAFVPADRPSAAWALAAFGTVTQPSPAPVPGAGPARPSQPPKPAIDYTDLPPHTQLTQNLVIEKRLGKPGAFGVAYKVIDTLGDVSRVVKLVLRDRHSKLERLTKEYRTLLKIPEHPNVVKVIDADLLPGDGTPFLL